MDRVVLMVVSRRELAFANIIAEMTNWRDSLQRSPIRLLFERTIENASSMERANIATQKPVHKNSFSGLP
jgi:hypothetical protein